ncbi:MAG: GxxExxY protein [bacterium]
MSLKYEKITEDIIGRTFEVYNLLDYGFLEKVYQKAFPVELLQRKHSVKLGYPILKKISVSSV